MDHGRPSAEDSEVRQICQSEGLYHEAWIRPCQFVVSQPSVTDSVNYPWDVIQADDTTAIWIPHIESIRFGGTSEEDTLNKLAANDVLMYCRTVSGKEYTISVRSCYEQISRRPVDPDAAAAEIAQGIYWRWIYMLQKGHSK